MRVAVELLGDERPELLQKGSRDIAELDELIEELLLASRLQTIDQVSKFSLTKSSPFTGSSMFRSHDPINFVIVLNHVTRTYPVSIDIGNHVMLQVLD